MPVWPMTSEGALSWLLPFRWVTVLAQIAVLAVASLVLDIPYSKPAVAILVGVTVACNGALYVWSRKSTVSSQLVIAVVLVIDALLLTGMLVFSGGPMNPFSVFYMVDVALAALVLRPSWAWAIAMLTSAAFASLFFLTEESQMHAMHHGRGGFTAHLRGMWLSYTLAAVVIAAFVSRVARALATRDAELQALRDLAARNEKLASLTTLAAGAAHELGTPLATITVIAGELKRACQGPLDSAAVAEDADLLRAEAERCHVILRKMASDAGAEFGEAPKRAPLAEICARVEKTLTPDRAARLRVVVRGEDVVVPLQPMVRVIADLVSNAFDATDAANRNHDVVLTLDGANGTVTCEIADEGTGMDDTTLRRVGEPFFTTKAPGKGLGLGMFLARTFAERLGGKVEIESTVGKGTRVRLSVPETAR